MLRIGDGAAVAADEARRLDLRPDRPVRAVLVDPVQVEARARAACHQARGGEVPRDLAACLGVLGIDLGKRVAEVEVRDLAGGLVAQPARRRIEVVLVLIGRRRLPERTAVVVVETRRVSGDDAEPVLARLYAPQHRLREEVLAALPAAGVQRPGLLHLRGLRAPAGRDPAHDRQRHPHPSLHTENRLREQPGRSKRPQAKKRRRGVACFALFSLTAVAEPR